MGDGGTLPNLIWVALGVVTRFADWVEHLQWLDKSKRTHGLDGMADFSWKQAGRHDALGRLRASADA